MAGVFESNRRFADVRRSGQLASELALTRREDTLSVFAEAPGFAQPRPQDIGLSNRRLSADHRSSGLRRLEGGAILLGYG